MPEQGRFQVREYRKKKRINSKEGEQRITWINADTTFLLRRSFVIRHSNFACHAGALAQADHFLNIRVIRDIRGQLPVAAESRCGIRG